MVLDALPITIGFDLLEAMPKCMNSKLQSLLGSLETLSFTVKASGFLRLLSFADCDFFLALKVT